MRWKHGKRYNYPAIRRITSPDDSREPDKPAVIKNRKRAAPMAPVNSPKNGIAAEVQKASEAPWFCKLCQIENKSDKKRCSSCRGWRGGKREIYTPKYSKNRKAKKKSIVASVMQGTNPGTEVQKVSEAPWFCNLCQIENQFDKIRCSSCWGWKGGTREFNATRSDVGAKNGEAKDIPDSPVESIVKVTQGTTPGTAKMWECHECFQLNHWRKYSCCSCGKRSGGRAVEMSWPSAMKTAVVITPSPGVKTSRTTSLSTLSSLSGSVAPSRQKRKNEPEVSDTWTCDRCASINHKSSLLCGECFASRKSRSSRGRQRFG